MKILLDTNILVHSHNKAAPNRGKAGGILRKAIRGEIEAYIAPQVLYEFFAVITNPKKVEHPLPPDEAAEICLDLWGCREIGKAEPTPMVTREVFRYVRELKLSKSGIFDCVLAVTAKENGLEMVYTENVDDFKAYSFLKASNPLV